MSEKIKVEFENAQEAAVLLQLIDIAVRARGMDVAEVSIALSRKITDAIKDAQKPTEIKKPKLAEVVDR